MRLCLESEFVRVQIIPSLGAGVAELAMKTPSGVWVPLMRTAPPDVTWFNDLASYLLIPWSNRIAGGTFDWRGTRHNPGADWADGSAIHGRVKDTPWQIRQRTPISVMLDVSSDSRANDGWPWKYDTEVSYRVRERVFSATVRVTHQSGGACADAMPVGIGFHPFWNRSLQGEADDVLVRASGLRRYPCKDMIPVGRPIVDEVTHGLASGEPLGRLALDDVFAGSCDGAEILWPSTGVRARYSCSEELGHTVLFTGSADSNGKMPGFFCLEPATMVNDGFNRASRGEPGTGVRELVVGGSLRVEWSVKIESAETSVAG